MSKDSMLYKCEGYDAATNQLGSDANPYTPGSDEWNLWSQGWNECYDEWLENRYANIL